MAKSQRMGRTAAVALRLACLAAAGCTAVQPIPPLADDLRFPARPADASWAAQHCGRSSATESECLQPALPLDGYFGQLAKFIWEADLDRRRFARLAAEKTNQASLFNAMLWPVGSYVGARNLAEPRASLLRDVGAFSLAVFGVLGSGIADRDRLYLEASKRMGCAIGLASGHLYAKADIGTLDSWSYASLRTLRPGMPDLSTVQVQLRDARDTFREHQVAVLAELKTLKSTPAQPLSAGDLRRQQVTGGGGAGGAATPRDTVAAFGQSAAQRLRQANEVLKDVEKINDEILQAASQLRGRQSETRRLLDSALVSRAPALSEPGLTAGQFAAAMAKFSQAFAASAPAAASAAGKAQGGPVAWQLDEKTLAPLTDASRQRLIAFEKGPGLRLQAAVDHAIAWRQQHDRQVLGAATAATEIGCSAALFNSGNAIGGTPATSSPGS